MSGGRSGYFGPTERTPTEIRAAAEKAVANEAFDSDVNNLLGQRLSRVNARDAEGTQRRLDAILDAIGIAGEERLQLLMGGSVAKRTHLEGLSDVDSLVLLTDPALVGLGPDQVRKRFADRLRDRLGRDEVASIREGKLAVTVTYRDGSEIQLLPAVRERGAFLIADKNGQAWSRINPEAFGQRLSKANEAMAGRLVPVIKLAKLAVSSFPETRQLSGYHIESLAIDAFRHYAGPKTYKAMLEHLFAAAAQRVLAPMSDTTGQSVHVDDDLGPAGSLSRKLAADFLGRTARKMTTSRSIEEWDGIVSLPEE